ncbi:hypothetical protein K474DRAFT_1670000 [Panus rudis PR-1116 ss-1]|nr:hypothetical protein K474DRAFT_1670000 [Panus rudis PR-1116 ss-1]
MRIQNSHVYPPFQFTLTLSLLCLFLKLVHLRSPTDEFDVLQHSAAKRLHFPLIRPLLSSYENVLEKYEITLRRGDTPRIRAPVSHRGR